MTAIHTTLQSRLNQKEEKNHFFMKSLHCFKFRLKRIFQIASPKNYSNSFFFLLITKKFSLNFKSCLLVWKRIQIVNFEKKMDTDRHVYFFRFLTLTTSNHFFSFDAIISKVSLFYVFDVLFFFVNYLPFIFISSY